MLYICGGLSSGGHAQMSLFMSFWWMEPCCLLFSLVMLVALKPTSFLSWSLFPWCVFFLSFCFQTFSFLTLRFVSCKQHVIGFYFYPLNNLRVLMGTFSPFTFNVIADILEFESTIVLSAFYWFCLFYGPLSFLSFPDYFLFFLFSLSISLLALHPFIILLVITRDCNTHSWLIWVYFRLASLPLPIQWKDLTTP